MVVGDKLGMAWDMYGQDAWRIYGQDIWRIYGGGCMEEGAKPIHPPSNNLANVLLMCNR